MSEEPIWIWGRHPVLEALRAGTVQEILLARGRREAHVIDDIRSEARAKTVPVREVDPSYLERVAPGQNTQGLAARVVRPHAESVEDLLEIAGSSARPAFILALDQVQDPQNLGALLRTAGAAGVHGVVVPERRSAAVSGVVAKVSAGALNHVPVVTATNLARALNAIREAGIWVVGLDGAGKQALYSVDLREPVALVVGSEESGMRRLTRQHCDFIVNLPILGPIESLNAAAAGSIAMYEVVRQRAAGG